MKGNNNTYIQVYSSMGQYDCIKFSKLVRWISKWFQNANNLNGKTMDFALMTEQEESLIEYCYFFLFLEIYTGIFM